MFDFLKKLFDYNEKQIRQMQLQVDKINLLEDKVRVLKDSDFKKETRRLQDVFQNGSTKDGDLLSWSFALVREASRRVLHERHYDVQLIAGVALNEGKIAQQRTGEGKTLSATTALYFNALFGKGAHLVTVNDYLVRRDAGWMGAIFAFLGLTTSAIIADQSFVYDQDYVDKEARDWRLSHLKPVSRKEAYLADITYGINSEFGFDYLRDNMASSPDDLVQRGFYYAIIDEADSVLIDEARTPHIISAPFNEDTSKYFKYAQIVKSLVADEDYKIDEKSRTANLTEKGIVHIESVLNVDNIYEKDFDTLFHIEASLKAETLFKNNKDYIVKDGEIVIVDEFTGRLLAGRRFSEGIHQAIEAKEGVNIQRESKTLATVSLQNYFRSYKKIAGMTGTASTESEEFHKIYKTDVVAIPTHRPMIRKDHPDMIYKTEKGKYDAIVEEIAQNYQKGRPVLIGTTSIEKNELLSSLLRKKGIPHELLNAKNHEREADIIASAGKKGAVTVATNMAGRGVDIILGGMNESQQDEEKKAKDKWQKEHDDVLALGGLYVIGTERHESRRIDNQLRGRSGRQGDPGETRFFVALEDDLMRIFGGEQISNLMTFFKFPEDQPLSHPMVSKAIEQAQVKVEGFNFDIRKHLVDYDDVLNKQREIVYSLRKKILVLSKENHTVFKDTILSIFHEELSAIINQNSFSEAHLTEEQMDATFKEMNFIIPISEKQINVFKKDNNTVIIQESIEKEIDNEYKKREKKFGPILWNEIIKSVFLSAIDKYWTDHLTAIEDLREGINLRGYAQLDPLVEYKNEAYSMFEKLISDINYEVTRRLFKIEIGEGPITNPTPADEKELSFKSASSVDPFSKKQVIQEKNDQLKAIKTMQNQVPQETSSEQGGFRVIPPGQNQNKPNRNDPCWCGSGKKYKRCHYPN